MNVIQTKIEGAFLIEPDVFGDNRGWFMESYSYEKYAACGIQVRFVQDNRSRTQHKGTIRGLHCQTNPKAQSKLLTCTRGALLDVAVDIRHGSPSYLKWIGVELTEENKKQIFIPKGCLHGFLTLTDDVEVEYKVDEYYAPEITGASALTIRRSASFGGCNIRYYLPKIKTLLCWPRVMCVLFIHCKALFSNRMHAMEQRFRRSFSPIFGWVKLSFFE